MIMEIKKYPGQNFYAFFFERFGISNEGQVNFISTLKNRTQDKVKKVYKNFYFQLEFKNRLQFELKEDISN